MAVSFPALRPTTRTYTAPEYAQLDPQYVGVVSYPRLLGSKPGRAKLSLTFENIPDSAAALIIASWMNSLTGFLPLALPPEIVSGIENANLANRMQTGQHLDWFFDGPPKQNSVIKGVSTVQVELVGDISNFARSEADPVLLVTWDGVTPVLNDPSASVIIADSRDLIASEISSTASVETSASGDYSSGEFFESGGFWLYEIDRAPVQALDFTYECWVQHGPLNGALQSYQVVYIETPVVDQDPFSVGIGSIVDLVDNEPVLSVSISCSISQAGTTFVQNIPIEAPQHLCIQRINGTFYYYFNGASVTTISAQEAVSVNFVDCVTILFSLTTQGEMPLANVKLGQIRLTPKRARYPVNGFTPDPLPFGLV